MLNIELKNVSLKNEGETNISFYISYFEKMKLNSFRWTILSNNKSNCIVLNLLLQKKGKIQKTTFLILRFGFFFGNELFYSLIESCYSFLFIRQAIFHVKYKMRLAKICILTKLLSILRQS